MSVALGDIAAWLEAEAGAELLGDPSLVIDRIGPLDGASASTISFLSNPRYQSQLTATAAGCVIVGVAMRDAATARGAAIVAPDPYYAFARLTQWWAARVRPVRPSGVHASAVIDATATVHASATVGPLAVVEADAQIGEGAYVGPHCVVGRGATVGEGTRLVAHVSFGHGCSIGARGIVHPGVVIGADGFGFAPHAGRYIKIEQLGNVRIGDDVEIGANTCIDRGALDDTVIADGVKLDNLVQIAHNVRIGENSAVAGCAAVAGSTSIGAGCTVAGAAMVSGHLTLGDGVHVSGGTAITRSIAKPGVYTGVYPFEDNASWEKNAATLRQLYKLRDRIRELEKKNAP